MVSHPSLAAADRPAATIVKTDLQNLPLSQVVRREDCLTTIGRRTDQYPDCQLQPIVTNLS